MRQAIASMNQYQQMGNTGAVAILQIKKTEQAFKAAVAKVERAKARLNGSDANVAIAIFGSYLIHIHKRGIGDAKNN